MKFDSIIPILLVIAFFILPSILKQVQARKKKTAAPETNKKNPSIFDRISARIQQFVQDLEKQAQQQRQVGKDQAIEWDKLAEDEDLDSVFESTSGDADFGEPQTIVSQEKIAPEKVASPARSVQPEKKELFPRGSVVPRPVSDRYRFKSNPLQNAVIWSEVLSKPIALRDK